jgi:hypothetical protein
MRSFIICIIYPIFLGVKIGKRRLDHLVFLEDRRGYTRYWWGNLRKSGHFGNPDADGRIKFSWIFRNWEVVLWAG